MRKFLLAATAVAGVAGLMPAAHAQMNGIQPGVAWYYGPFSGGYPGNSGPAPGKVEVHLRGRMFFVAAGGMSSTGDNFGGYKAQQKIAFGEYFRLYPSAQAVAANGMHFGIFAEVRQNAGGPAAGGPTGANTLIWRRAAGFVGGNWGALRFGQTDGSAGMFAVGQFENFGDNWNGDGPAFVMGNSVPNWLVPENSGNYGYSKIVYVSPSFSGFDFGLTYQPTLASSGEPGCGNAASGFSCPWETSSPVAGDGAKNLNEIELSARYQGKLGAMGVAASASYLTSGLVSVTAVGGNPYKTPSLVDAGVVLSFGGLAVGGHIDAGAANGNGGNNIRPTLKGGKDEFWGLVGASYAFGPYIVGASYFATTNNGLATVAANKTTGVGTRRETGLAIGGTYAWSAAAYTSLNYLYGTRHQGGYDFQTGATGTGIGNSTRASVFTLITSIAF